MMHGVHLLGKRTVLRAVHNHLLVGNQRPNYSLTYSNFTANSKQRSTSFQDQIINLNNLTRIYLVLKITIHAFIWPLLVLFMNHTWIFLVPLPISSYKCHFHLDIFPSYFPLFKYPHYFQFQYLSQNHCHSLLLS